MNFLKEFSYYSALVCLFLVSSVSAQNAATNISVEKIQKHAAYLGSDIFEGRGTGTTGGELAAKYLAQEFSKIDLIPLGSNGTYYQYIPMHGSQPKIGSRLTIYDTNENQTLLELLDDYILLNVGDQTFTPTPLPLIFAGYGIIAPEYDYNDYQSINVEGKVIVVIEGEPLSNDEKYFDGENPTIYSLVESKKRFAISRGASGIIIIPNLIDEPNFDWEKIRINYLFENVQLAYSVTSNLSVLLNPNIADKLFIDSPFSLNDIFEMHIGHRMMSFPLRSKISFKGEFVRRDFISSNIVGMIEGSDNELKDSYFVVSAHYDHLGIGPEVEGDSIYNGVFDNAIGVSVLLEIASAIKSMSEKPKRSIIFALFTGEEKGLLGSRYYVDHSPVPLYKTIANLNIDGIASFDKFNSVIGIGSEYSNLVEFLKLTTNQMDLNVTKVPSIFRNSDAFSSSDQISFAIAGVPSILIMDGLDYQELSQEEGIKKFIEFSEKYYHTPKDDLNLPINYDAVLQHSEFLMQFILTVSGSSDEPQWNENSPYLNIRLRSIAEKR